MNNNQRKELADVITSQTIELFKVMFDADIEPYMNSNHNFNDDDLISKVTLSEEGFEIVLKFVFPRHLLVKLLNDMYGSVMANHESAREDAICEISNIVCGGLKKHLNEGGHSLEMSLPSIYCPYKTQDASDKECLKIDFFLLGEAFSVDLKMDETP
ncbi:MAG: hypothetical protein COB36_02940 [Alphaproteobacteria bacterium]|nr:MAG: hypothetical protein COB36_02940 [Alphaproteobacteria bacterium]